MLLPEKWYSLTGGNLAGPFDTHSEAVSTQRDQPGIRSVFEGRGNSAEHKAVTSTALVVLPNHEHARYARSWMRHCARERRFEYLRENADTPREIASGATIALGAGTALPSRAKTPTAVALPDGIPARTTLPTARIEPLKSPYPYFGGKSTVAPVVWRHFGDVANYVEPFLGSAAMLLARPADHLQKHRIETVNDKDGFISNFWRAVQTDPDAVARYADWPVVENDLHARHLWLTKQRDSLTERLEGDPDFCDLKAAGWWVWGMSSWLGSGFCSGAGPWRSVDGRLIKDGNTGAGVARQLPRLTGLQGVNRKRLHLCDEGRGVVRQVPHLAHGEQGIHGVTRKLPMLAHDQRGASRAEFGVSRQIPELKSARGVHRALTNTLTDYMIALQRRLRSVRVCSGDWTRVTGPGVTVGNGLTAVFLDPPYVHEGRDTTVYTHDEHDIAYQCRQWAIENGNNPLLRIAYCGYEDGLAWPDGWSAYHWKADGGYGNQGQGQGRKNAKREVVWFSPHCLKIDAPAQLALFAATATATAPDAARQLALVDASGSSS